MEAVSLNDGDLHWVFPTLVDESELRSVLRQAADQIEQLASHLGVRPAWTGDGLEFHRHQDGRTASLWGCVDSADVSMVVELNRPTDPVEWTVAAPPPWSLTAHIAVRCAAPVDCGMHYIEEKESEHLTPLDAAEAMQAAATWLHERGTEVPPGSWRQLDPRAGHS
jgi:hypothetical protein